MDRKFFVFTLIFLFTVITIFINNGRTHDEYPGDFLLPSSEYADVQGEVSGGFAGNDTNVHIHGIAYAHWTEKGIILSFSQQVVQTLSQLKVRLIMVFVMKKTFY